MIEKKGKEHFIYGEIQMASTHKKTGSPTSKEMKDRTNFDVFVY